MQRKGWLVIKECLCVSTGSVASWNHSINCDVHTFGAVIVKDRLTFLAPLPTAPPNGKHTKTCLCTHQ